MQPDSQFDQPAAEDMTASGVDGSAQMSSSTGTVSAYRGLLTRLVVALLVLHLLHLGVVAWRLPLDYWDGYDYLLYAQALRGNDLARLFFAYRVGRPPLVPLLLETSR